MSRRYVLVRQTYRQENHFHFFCFFPRNNGTCIEVNSTLSSSDGMKFFCECSEGFNGVNCQLQIDLCGNITCQNNGFCRTVDMVWTCICLNPSLYFGQYCEHQTSALTVKKALSKSFASVAITAIVLTCSFVVVMDILKYVFHINPAKVEKVDEEPKKPPVSKVPKIAIRFQYIP